MRKKILAAALAAAAVAMVAPSMASATSVPALPSGVDQAYLADSNGDPQNGNVTITGPLTLTGAASISCTNNDFDVDYFDDGTTAVNSFSASGCTVAGFPSCPVSVTPTSLPWGDRFGYDTSSSQYKDYVNVSIDVTLGAAAPTCPASGTIPETGVLSPHLTITGTTLSATFTGSASGSLTGPLGSADVSGTVSGTLPSGSQFIF